MTSRRYQLDFRDLMRQCEENYIRLLPLMRALGEEAALTLDTGQQRPHRMTLQVLERAPYTTTLRLQDQALTAGLAPATLTVQLYHDARLAEVIQASPFRRVQARNPYPNPHMHQRDEKAQWNRLLGEWLSHMQENGRSALPV